eukprot:c39659_g1_i1.p1 GENE.c39659_g1_i1~~c39659_g1_i1.p1  ORF type:complete len:553 (+),score=123.77 c39659_g1_i1:173-1660(+)
MFLSKGRAEAGKGMAGMDDFCQQEAKAIGLGDVGFKALLADEAGCNGRPCRRATAVGDEGDGQIDWILFPDATYYMVDNKTVIGTTNEKALFDFPFQTQVAACANQISGIYMDFTTETDLTCDSWRNNSDKLQMAVGWACSNTSMIFVGGSVGCGLAEPVYCIGPTNSRATKPLCSEDGSCLPSKCALPVADSLDCRCRCGCAWSGSKQHATRPTGSKAYGAWIVRDEELSSIPTLSKPLNITDDQPCYCKPKAGQPACQGQYPTPDTSFLKAFVSSDSPLTSDDTIIFFGDSITWLGGYKDLIREEMNKVGLNATLINHGINGGTTSTIEEQFGDALDAAKPTVVSVMIGINDVWFAGCPKCSNSTAYQASLSNMVAMARARNVKIALATVSVIGERIDGQNGHDDLLVEFQEAAKSVGKALGVPVADVHQDFLEYLRAFNAFPAGQGLGSGVLTFDGVHPCMGGLDSCPSHTGGNYLLANSISRGLLQALVEP